MGDGSDGTSWVFKLVDGISSAASKMRESVKGVEGAARLTDGAIAALNEHLAEAEKELSHYQSQLARAKELGDVAGYRKYTQLVDEAKKHVYALSQETEKLPKKTEGAFNSMKEKASDWAQDFFFTTEGIKTACEGLEQAFDLVKEALEYSLDVADFKRNATLGLDAMLSTGYQASEVLEKLESWAKQSGMAKDTFATFSRQLLGAGFKEGELKPLLGALSDIQAVNGGQVSAAQELLGQITRIKSLDKVNSRELASLGSLGISPDSIYQVIAAQRKITLAQAKALFDESSGKGLKGTEANQAILDAIRGRIDKGGKLGQAGFDWMKGSVPAQIQKAKDAFAGMFEHVDSTKFAAGIGHLGALFSGAQGEHFAKTITAGFDAVGSWLAKLDEKKIDSFVAGLGQIAGTFVSIGSTIASVVGWFGQFITLDDLLTAIKVTVYGVAAVFGLVVAAIVGAVGAIPLFGAAIWFGLKKAWDAITGIDWAGIGKSIVEGLDHGITASWRWLVSKFEGLIGMLPASVKKILGIASPSRVFAGLGAQTMAGFAVGLDAVDVRGAMAESVRPPSLGDMTPNAVSVGGLTGGGGGRVFQVRLEAPITIHGAHDAEGTADAVVQGMRRVFLPELADAFDQLALELGA